MSALIKWMEGLSWWQGFIVLLLVGAALNFVRSGNPFDGDPGQTCIDNPRNNDVECYLDPGYQYDADGDVVRIPTSD
jgi:hypothetical protein